MFFCEICEIFKITFFKEHPQTVASEAVTENSLGNSAWNEKFPYNVIFSTCLTMLKFSASSHPCPEAYFEK